MVMSFSVFVVLFCDFFRLSSLRQAQGRLFVFRLALHALYDFLFLHPISQDLHHVYFYAPFLRGRRKSLLNPFVGFAAYIHHHVSTCNGRNILSRRLITVQVRAVLDEQFQVNRVGTPAKNVLEPVVLRVCHGNNRNFLRCTLGLGFCSASGQQQSHGEERLDYKSLKHGVSLSGEAFRSNRHNGQAAPTAAGPVQSRLPAARKAATS